jgi:hypothetical protein
MEQMITEVEASASDGCLYSFWLRKIGKNLRRSWDLSWRQKKINKRERRGKVKGNSHAVLPHSFVLQPAQKVTSVVHTSVYQLGQEVGLQVKRVHMTS